MRDLCEIVKSRPGSHRSPTSSVHPDSLVLKYVFRYLY